MSDANLVF